MQATAVTHTDYPHRWSPVLRGVSVSRVGFPVAFTAIVKSPGSNSAPKILLLEDSSERAETERLDPLLAELPVLEDAELKLLADEAVEPDDADDAEIDDGELADDAELAVEPDD